LAKLVSKFAAAFPLTCLPSIMPLWPSWFKNLQLLSEVRAHHYDV